MATITIPKKEYDILRDFYTKAKKKLTHERLMKSVRESHDKKPKAVTRAQFRKEFGI